MRSTIGLGELRVLLEDVVRRVVREEFARLSPLTSPALPRLVTTREAAEYLRFGTSGAIRNAVARGQLTPMGAGPRGSHMFTPEELDRFLAKRTAARGRRVRVALPQPEPEHTQPAVAPPRARRGAKPDHSLREVVARWEREHEGHTVLSPRPRRAR